MKKILMALGLMATSAMTLANPIVGVWQTYEDGQAKAQVQITQNGNSFSGKIACGNTKKAKEYVGNQVLLNVKATSGNKYTGKAKHPSWGFLPAVDANITVNGNSLTVSTKLKGSQTWKKVDSVSCK